MVTNKKSSGQQELKGGNVYVCVSDHVDWWANGWVSEHVCFVDREMRFLKQKLP